jgi:hypothetical protein
VRIKNDPTALIYKKTATGCGMLRGIKKKSIDLGQRKKTAFFGLSFYGKVAGF